MTYAVFPSSRRTSARTWRVTSLVVLLIAAPGFAFAQTVAAQAHPSSVPVMNALLPHDLSPWSMFLAADWVVKLVMTGLACASVVTWTTLLAKSIELTRAVRRQRVTLAVVNRARSLAEAGVQIDAQDAAGAALVGAAQDELRLSADATEDRDGLKERIVSHLERIEAAIGRRMSKGTGVLATIGATAPFVGLFGTVWGIMNSFIGISKAQTTNLAVVAPGIAEALLATAIGLVAAIPAVVIYNHFARQITAYKALVADTSAGVLRLVSRDLSRSGACHAQASGRPRVAG
ncbi:tonB-system energizer ExbB [Cupriavidus basilensis]|uniref:tonB-system energizer ExbB n=1 Tax=Cupriavidus basilensis TaxID=68895 RepID=UPI000750C563|nr:tonB-system energizer ExbB [Cupriavidus basilensis]